MGICGSRADTIESKRYNAPDMRTYRSVMHAIDSDLDEPPEPIPPIDVHHREALPLNLVPALRDPLRMTRASGSAASSSSAGQQPSLNPLTVTPAPGYSRSPPPNTEPIVSSAVSPSTTAPTSPAIAWGKKPDDGFDPYAASFGTDPRDVSITMGPPHTTQMDKAIETDRAIEEGDDERLDTRSFTPPPSFIAQRAALPAEVDAAEAVDDGPGPAHSPQQPAAEAALYTVPQHATRPAPISVDLSPSGRALTSQGPDSSPGGLFPPPLSTQSFARSFGESEPPTSVVGTPATGTGLGCSGPSPFSALRHVKFSPDTNTTRDKHIPLARANARPGLSRSISPGATPLLPSSATGRQRSFAADDDSAGADRASPFIVPAMSFAGSF